MIKKKQGRRIVALLLCVLLSVSTLSVFAVAEDGIYLDTAAHWCREPIRFWTQRKVVMGCGNDLFRPNEPITRRMAAVIVCRFLGFDMATPEESPFPDVNARSDYAGAIADCKEADIVKGNNFGLYAPDEDMTRNEAMLMLSRVYRMEPREDLSALDVFADPQTAAVWSRGEIAALVEADIVHGWSGKLRATDVCTRAEFVEMLRAMVSDYITTPGIYDLDRITSDKPLFIAVDGVTVIGSTEAPIVINKKVNGGTLDLNGSTVGGDIYVRGEDNTLINGKPGTVIKTGPDAGTTTVNGVEVPPDTTYIIPYPTGGGSTGGGGGGSTTPSTPDEELKLDWWNDEQGIAFGAGGNEKFLPGDQYTHTYEFDVKATKNAKIDFTMTLDNYKNAGQDLDDALRLEVTVEYGGNTVRKDHTLAEWVTKSNELDMAISGKADLQEITYTFKAYLPTSATKAVHASQFAAKFQWELK